jgi:hypothetical protein
MAARRPARRAGKEREPVAERIMAGRRAASVPHEFVLEALESLHPWTRPMFGCIAVYVDEKIVLILRDRPASPRDNGVWLATSREHHDSLREEFPRMRSIEVFESGVTSWQVLAADDGEFEDFALRACALIRAGDPRIGKTPKPKSRRPKKAAPRRRRS